MKRSYAPLLAVLLVVFVHLPGCGGGSGNHAVSGSAGGRGVVNITIHWPDRSRLIPEASNSIRLVVTTKDIPSVTTVKEKVVLRPSGKVTQVTLDGLPEVELQIQATAHPEADGTGVAQAIGNTQVILTPENKVANTSFTMGTTIAKIDVEPGDPEVDMGKTLALTMQAKDAAGAPVMTSTNHITWESSTPSIATVDPRSGIVSGVMKGSAEITVTDSESGKSGSIVVNVTELIISPQNPEVLSLGSGDPSTWPTIQFTANGTPPYVWSIDDGLAGSIDSMTGKYTSQRHMATSTIRVRDSKGREGSTQVTVTTSDIRLGDPDIIACTLNNGPITPGDGFGIWRVSAPVGKHILTITNRTSTRQGATISTFHYFGHLSFVFGENRATSMDLFFEPGQSMNLVLERLQ